MPSTLSDARALLDAAGYRTLIPLPTSDFLYFEDGSILGAVHVIGSISEIVQEWEHIQDRFLRENSTRLIADSTKAWNCYLVLLTSEEPNKEDTSTLLAIEEDFRGTRKIVKAGVSSKSSVESALAPVLPLRRLLTLTPDDVNARLAPRLGRLGPSIQALLTEADAEQIAGTLIGSE